MNNTRGKLTVRSLSVYAMCAALVFCATFINVRLPLPGNGGLIHLGNVPLVVASILFGKKCGAFSGAVGMSLFDIAGGWVLWAPFTFVIRALMGFLIGTISQKGEGKSFFWNALGITAGGAVLIVGYYGAEVIIFGNILAPMGSIPGNLLQVLSAYVIGLAITPLIGTAWRRLR